MTENNKKIFTGSPFHIESEDLAEQCGFGRYKVNIFMNGDQIGSYIRNYSNVLNTFYPFMCKGKWYALYSEDYTCTSLMSLPECKKIGGEDPDSFGFCPVELWVPAFLKVTRNIVIKNREDICNDTYYFDNSSFVRKELKEGRSLNTRRMTTTLGEWDYTPFGFVAGCIWGDDSSWKIQYLDLSRADEGIIIRDDRLDYCELPDKMDLQDAIHLNTSSGKSFSMSVARVAYYDKLTTDIKEFMKYNDKYNPLRSEYDGNK